MDIFCKIINKEIPSNIIFEDKDLMVLLDAFPKQPGHTLIIPKQHYRDLDDIDEIVLNLILKKAKEIKKLLEERLNPDSIVIIQNNGEEQNIKHFHLHLIPKYNRDFKQTIEETYRQLIK